MRTILSQRPVEGDRLADGTLTAVKAVRLGATHARVQLHVRAAALARPVAGGGQQILAGSLGAALRIDRQILDPGTTPEANRVEVLVDGAEADDPAAGVGHEH